MSIKNGLLIDPSSFLGLNRYLYNYILKPTYCSIYDSLSNNWCYNVLIVIFKHLNAFLPLNNFEDNIL